MLRLFPLLIVSVVFFDDGIDYLRLFVAEKLLSECGTV